MNSDINLPSAENKKSQLRLVPNSSLDQRKMSFLINLILVLLLGIVKT